MGAESASRVWFETGGRGKSRSRSLVVGGWLAGAQGKAVGPGLRGGRLWLEADRLVGTCSGRELDLEGLGSRRSAGGGNLRPAPNLVGRDMVSARDAKEPPELMTAMLHHHQQDRCRLFKKSRKMCDFPSAQCVECVGKGAVLPLPHRFSICSVFCHLYVPFPRPVGRLDACRTMPAGSGTKAIAPAIQFRHPVGIWICLESGCRKCQTSSWRDTREW